MPSVTPDPGFVALPRPLLDRLLAADLGKREWALLLLVARLTFGVRGARWAALAPSDLASVGIGRTHAGECLKGLLERGLIVADGGRARYRLGDRLLNGEADGAEAERRALLAALVRRQLAGGARRRGSPETGTDALPKRERKPYRNGNDPGIEHEAPRRYRSREMVSVEEVLYTRKDSYINR